MKKISTGLSRSSLTGQMIMNQTIGPNTPGRLTIFRRKSREKLPDVSESKISLNLKHMPKKLKNNKDSDNQTSRSFRKHAQFKKESEYLSRKITQKIAKRNKISLCKLHDEVIKTLESSVNLKEVMFTKKYEEPHPDFKSNSLKKKIVFMRANTERNLIKNR